MKNIYFCSRTSHEVRGLKYILPGSSRIRPTSHLTRGAWIEIALPIGNRGVTKSHLTRGAWIEIGASLSIGMALPVAPHTRCVD